MMCPRCPGELESAEFKETKVGSCVECMGMWFGEEELSRLRAGRGSTLNKAPAKFDPSAQSVSTLHCPLCAKAMERIVVGQEAKAELDRCRAHGIWFDKGEVEHLESILQGSKGWTPGKPRTVFNKPLQSSSSSTGSWATGAVLEGIIGLFTWW